MKSVTKTKIDLSLRDFALPSPLRGSIEVQSGLGLSFLSRQEEHLEAQRRRAKEIEGYQTEFPLLFSFEGLHYLFNVSGRIDGLVETRKTSPLIEEIKTSFDIDSLFNRLAQEPEHPYCLQLRTYAYIYFKTYEILPETQFFLVSTRTQESKILSIDLDLPAYENWLGRRLQELDSLTRELEAEEKRRKRAAKRLRFPFSKPRQGQLELMTEIERSFNTHDRLLLQAPTGMGKTLAVLFPTLKSGLAQGQRLVYLTPKNSQHQLALEAVSNLSTSSQTTLKALLLTAKSKICFKDEPICNPDYCEFAKDHYSKLSEHNVIAKLAREKILDREKLQEYGKQYEVCPFELSVDAIARSDVIVGDYNYVFSPKGSLSGRLSQPSLSSEKPVLVIDEVHNLPDRACSYFSPALSTNSLESLFPSLRNLSDEFRLEACMLLSSAIEQIRSCKPSGKAPEGKCQIPRERFILLKEKLRTLSTRYLRQNNKIEKGDAILRLTNEWSDFCDALDLEGDEFFTTYRETAEGALIKVNCCDASTRIGQHYKNYTKVVAFSATLKPFDFYSQLCGLEHKKLKIGEFQSQFPRSNRKVLIIPQVSTKLEERHSNYSKIAQTIEKVTALKRGNYLAFFPSFDFMQAVKDILRPKELKIIAQRRETSREEAQKILEELKDSSQANLLLAVQGGIFSEGIDYKGGMAIGVFIVGPGLPAHNFERQLVRDYFQKRYGSGFDYAYTYPAMTRVVQAAGRVIRSADERGIIIMLDQRFLQDSYASCLPSGWFDHSARELVSTQILKDIGDFWQDD